jgi:hypothetical protein
VTVKKDKSLKILKSNASLSTRFLIGVTVRLIKFMRIQSRDGKTFLTLFKPRSMKWFKTIFKRDKIKFKKKRMLNSRNSKSKLFRER